jgi:DNA-binding winged helix-turn-helix (wHTH) protein/tetratricopeptide (TPR) repeat protein
MRYRFGRYELDEEAGELRLDGVAQPVQPKPFELLCLLVRERERVVPSDELLDAIWPGTIVTPSSLTRAVSLARKAIGDSRRGELIRSVSRRGYRFVGDVVELARAPAAGGAPETAAPPPAAPASGATPDAQPFVGRTDSVELLRRAWQDAASGRGSLVLLTGPAGIGKTRLAERFAADAERGGAACLTGRCREDVPAFWPWAQVLRQLVERGADTAPLAQLPGGADELAEWIPEWRPDGGAPAPRSGADRVSPERRRFLLFDALARTLRLHGRREPLLVVLEDIHWAGSTSLQLLEHLLYELGDASILVIATVRDEPRPGDHPLEVLLPTLRQQPSCHEVALQTLSRREVGELLAGILGRSAPADLTTELYACTEGVPLFLREAIRMLADRGDLDQPERVRRWAVTLPSRALDLIRRPLGRLSPEAARLVGAAAVLGREFGLAVAAAVAELPRDAALDHLDEAERAGVVEPLSDAPGHWRFTHALFREAASDALPAGTRARLHARAAAELERRHAGDIERVLPELATHTHAALAVVEPERAFELAWRAAERCSRLLAHDQAAVHYEQALAALDQFETLDPGRRLETLLALGAAHGLARERDRRRSAYTEAIDVARRLERPVDRARAAIGFCDISEWAPKDPEALRLLEEAAEELPEEAIAERAGLLTRLAYLSMRERPERAEPLAREAVATARDVGDDETLQDALYALSFILAGPDHADERTVLAAEAADAAERSGPIEPTLITMLDMACDRLMHGDLANALHWRTEAGRTAGSDPLPGTVWHFRLFDAGFALLRGDFDECRRLGDEATRLGRRIGHPYARGVERALTVWLHRERGDYDELLGVVEPRLPIRVGPIDWMQALAGRTLAAAGRHDEARVLYEDLIVPGLDRIPRNIRWNSTVVELAHLCADLRDADRADGLLELLGHVAGQHGVLPMPIFYAGPFSAARGRLHAVRGELREAESLLDDALESIDALGARPTRARALTWQAEVLGRRGDRTRARELLAEARSIAESLGMRGVAAEAGGALETLRL